MVNKKALLVGVNKYKYVRSLNGCVNDVRNMADILTNFYDFTPDNIRTIVDESVTRNHLMNRLDWLIDDAQEGDLLLFHFSGHGSQVQDRDGDELEDSMDEILCLHDMDFRNTDSYLVDDDLNDIIDRLPKDVYLTVCIDACHSGTATRDIGLLTSGLQIPSERMKMQPRYLKPPADLELRNYGKSLNIRRLGSKAREDKKNAGFDSSARAKHVLMAGCMDEQTSADAFLNNDYNGAFTYYLCKTVRETRGVIAYQDLIKKVQERLAFNSFSQIPQLNGNDRLRDVNFLSIPAKYELTCEEGHPLVCEKGHPPKGYKPTVEPKKDKDKTKKRRKPFKRVYISSKKSKRAISRDIILTSDSEFVGSVRDLTNLAVINDEKDKDKKRNVRRDVLGETYKPDLLDILEYKTTGDDKAAAKKKKEKKVFELTNLIEFRPDEQRAIGADKIVEPVPLDVRCDKNEEAALLSFEDGVWSWHFKNENNGDQNTRDISSDNILSFSVPFKVQHRTTRGIWSKMVYVFKFAKDWIKDGSNVAIRNMLQKHEEGAITEGLKLIEHNKGFLEGLSKEKAFSDWGSIKGDIKKKNRALLFIHGTASSLEGGYADINTKILEALKDKYPVILGYDHFTLSKTPEENAQELLNNLNKLKKDKILDNKFKVDVVTHSRGGLVLRSFVELMKGCDYVDNVIMAACPASGTDLANPRKWDSLANMINILSNIFAFAGVVPLKIFFGLVGGLVKFASSKVKNPKAIPGIWAMNPNSDFIKRLNQNSGNIGGKVTYNTIGSDFEPSGLLRGGIKDDIADGIADAFFGDPNDLVVDEERMKVKWPNGITSGKVDPNFRYEPDEHVYHLNYFRQAETYKMFGKYFKVDLDTVIKECVSTNLLKNNRLNILDTERS
jgi:hypothetical protein